MKPRSPASHPVVKSYLKSKGLSPRWMGWGYKGSGRLAKWLAKKYGGDLYLFEDAPIRSLYPGYQGAVYGITIDRKGAMFDATGDSTLIDQLNKGQIIVSENVPTLIAKIRALGASKYNGNLPFPPLGLKQFKKGVLLVDQSKGDAALEYAGVTDETFQQMVNDVLSETPEGTPIYLKTHPDQKHRAKKSCYPLETIRQPRITILPSTMRVADCFTFCEKVYVASSLVGMEALLYQKEVITYGWNFYTGWGLTTDRCPTTPPERKRERSIEELFQAYYLDYSYYAHPNTSEQTDLETILDHIEYQFQSWEKRRGHYHLSPHLSPWHKHILRKCLSTPTTTIEEERGNTTTALHWGMKGAEQESVTRVEDGFIRSRGLGANFHYPLSLVLDDQGIYFNAEKPSRLETILNTADWTSDELAEGKELHHYLVENHITKYLHTPVSERNVMPESAKEAHHRGKRIILVPGQVDSDASIQYGSPEFKRNRDFLKHLRETYPEAYLIFKPHPDLLTRSRKDAPLWEGIEHDCDFIAKEGDVISWIKTVDEIHTMTSTVGFEALMHKKPVFTYGIPFYAGWGLTTDHLSCNRRTEQRSLNELITAVLIKYPLYIDPNNGEFLTALKAAQLLNDKNYQTLEPPRSLRILARLKQWRNRLRNSSSEE